MTEQSPDEQKPVGRGCVRSFAIGCLSFVLLIIGLFALTTSQSSARIEERVEALRADLTAFKEGRPRRRPVLFGEAVPGNAVWDYNALEWTVDPRWEWKKRPPKQLPEGLTQLPEGFETALLGRALWEATKTQPPQELSPQTRALLAQVASLTQHIRAALRRDECAWDEEVGSSWFFQNLKFIGLQLGVELLAFEAASAAPDEALALSLEGLAFGSDVGRRAILRVKSVATMIQYTAFQSCAAALARHPSPTALRSALAILERLPPIDHADAVQLARLEVESRFSILADRPAIPGRKVSFHEAADFGGGAFPDALGAILPSSLHIAREWTYFDRMMDRFQAIWSAPYAEREPAFQRILGELEADQSHPRTNDFIPNIIEVARRNDRSPACLRLLRIATAAELFRQERGAFPEALAELAPNLGGAIPKDPCGTTATADFLYAREGRDALFSAPNLNRCQVRLKGA